MEPAYIPIWFVVFLLSLTVHEAAHAWSASLFGAETGRYLGRVTLNPIPHIDLFGTIIFPLAAIITGGMMFGWAKPVPFDSSKLRDRKVGEIGIAMAGPLSNFLLAFIFLLLLKVVFFSPLVSPVALGSLAPPIEEAFRIGVRLNLLLGVFNLLPIPPLDGSHVMRNLLPTRLAESYAQLYSFGFIILLGLMMVGLIDKIVGPMLSPLYRLSNVILNL
jgi:Zn-dependent protease